MAKAEYKYHSPGNQLSSNMSFMAGQLSARRLARSETRQSAALAIADLKARVSALIDRDAHFANDVRALVEKYEEELRGAKAVPPATAPAPAHAAALAVSTPVAADAADAPTTSAVARGSDDDTCVGASAPSSATPPALGATPPAAARPFSPSRRSGRLSASSGPPPPHDIPHHVRPPTYCALQACSVL